MVMLFELSVVVHRIMLALTWQLTTCTGFSYLPANPQLAQSFPSFLLVVLHQESEG
jgi:hypothetical protein